jgi:hypothetical protein
MYNPWQVRPNTQPPSAMTGVPSNPSQYPQEIHNSSHPYPLRPLSTPWTSSYLLQAYPRAAQPMPPLQHMVPLEEFRSLQLAIQDIQRQNTHLQQQLLYAREMEQKLQEQLRINENWRFNLEQHNHELQDINRYLRHENAGLKQQIVETHPVSYNEDNNQLSLLSSAIATTKNRPGVFEYEVLTLPELSSPDLTTAIELPDLRFSLENDSNNIEYFQQFVPFIMEEVRASIAAQMNKIKTQQLCPFTASFDPANKESAGEFAVTLICHTQELPKLDHDFQNEAVFVVIRQPESDAKNKKNKKWDTTEPLQGFLAIASSTPQRHLPNTINSVFSLLMLKDQYEQNAQYWQKKEYVMEVHWLHGLIPAAREYDVCIEPYFYSLTSQIIRGSLPAWPVVEQDNTLLPHISQNNVVQSLTKAQSGIFCLQGPPGTGKTTTIVNLIGNWSNEYPDKRTLLCAPSNSAVQVVFERTTLQYPELCIAVIGSNKLSTDPKSNAFVRHYVLHLQHSLSKLLVLQEPSLEQLKTTLLQEYERIFQDMHDLNQHPRKEFVKPSVQNKVREIESHFSWKKDLLRQKDAYFDHEILYSITQESIDFLKEYAHYIEYFLTQRAQVVFVTLTGSGRDFLKRQISHFEQAIVDEASQALIPTTLIPLVHFNPNIYVLVGDPKQLPATLVSKTAAKNGYNRSLLSCFIERAQAKNSTCSYKMLTKQFRMDPKIAAWPSQQYYAGALETDNSVLERASLFSPQKQSVFSQPALFFNIRGHEMHQGPSFINEKEAEIIAATTVYLLQCGIQSGQIGIITFYAAQACKILQNLKQRLKELPAGLTVSTVDSFQGSERDIIMISAVRTKKDTGFMADSNRINVSMTRARHHLYLFGNTNAIRQSNSDLANYAQNVAVIQENKLVTEITMSG